MTPALSRKQKRQNIARGRGAVGVRSCLVSREQLPKSQLLRFAVSPAHQLVCDIREKLPGRGLWIAPERDLIAEAVRKNLFQKKMRRKVILPDEGVAALAIEQIRNYMAEILGLMRRSGQAVQGLVKIEQMLRARKTAAALLVLNQTENAALPSQKLLRLAQDCDVAVIVGLPETLAAETFDRDAVRYVLLCGGGLYDKFLALAEKHRRLEAANPALQQPQILQQCRDTNEVSDESRVNGRIDRQ